MLQSNDRLRNAAASPHPIYLLQTANLEKVQRALDAWNASTDITSIVIDSWTNWWDVMTSTRDTSDERKSMLSWAPIKEADRLFKIALTAGGKNVIGIAHEKELMKRVPKPGGGWEFIQDGTAPRLERTSAHWADVVLRLDLPSDKPYPILTVTNEGVGGQGGIQKGVAIENPTFRMIATMLKFDKLVLG